MLLYQVNHIWFTLQGEALMRNNASILFCACLCIVAISYGVYTGTQGNYGLTLAAGAFMIFLEMGISAIVGALDRRA